MRQFNKYSAKSKNNRFLALISCLLGFFCTSNNGFTQNYYFTIVSVTDDNKRTVIDIRIGGLSPGWEQDKNNWILKVSSGSASVYKNIPLLTELPKDGGKLQYRWKVLIPIDDFKVQLFNKKGEVGSPIMENNKKFIQGQDAFKGSGGQERESTNCASSVQSNYELILTCPSNSKTIFVIIKDSCTNDVIKQYCDKPIDTIAFSTNSKKAPIIFANAYRADNEPIDLPFKLILNEKPIAKKLEKR